VFVLCYYDWLNVEWMESVLVVIRNSTVFRMNTGVGKTYVGIFHIPDVQPVEYRKRSPPIWNLEESTRQTIPADNLLASSHVLRRNKSLTLTLFITYYTSHVLQHDFLEY
jgi:hypothetical protein